MKIPRIETHVCHARMRKSAEVKKHPFQQELPQRVFYRDGSVGDW